ncbi:MAG: macro domain-containing protein [Minicystis sp.]
MIEAGRGDLLKTRADALVNPVNTTGLMDTGLALQFKGAFPDNFNAFRIACVTGKVQVGQVFAFALGATPPRYILNVAIKAHARSSTSPAYIEAGLADLVAHVKRLGIQSVAVPALGCDPGGLQWRNVRPRIEAAFAPLPDVKVVLFAPAGA